MTKEKMKEIYDIYQETLNDNVFMFNLLKILIKKDPILQEKIKDSLQQEYSQLNYDEGFSFFSDAQHFIDEILKDLLLERME